MSPTKTNLTIVLACLLALPLQAQENTALPNPSFEQPAEGRPKGWRMFPSPEEAAGEFFVSAGQEGSDTHTGACALQFKFPQETSVSQCVWMADPVYGGMAAAPGRYSASFWIKAEDLRTGFHTWVVITGFTAENKRIDELGRSDYLGTKDLPHGEWTRVSFSFDIPEGLPVARLAPSVIFKTSPDSSINLVPQETRILVDDLYIEKK